MVFNWLDIEAEAEAMGDLDIENFPTLLIRRGESIVFFAPCCHISGTCDGLSKAFRNRLPSKAGSTHASESGETAGRPTRIFEVFAG